MQRKNYVFGNWKLYKKFNDIQIFFKQFIKFVKKDKKIYKNKDLIHGFAPSHLGVLPAINFAKNKTNILVQDVGCNKEGAFTGQVAYWQLNEYKIQYAIVGHSETRKYLGNTDENVNKTIQILLQNNIIPIICIGEPLSIYKSNKTKQYLLNQIKITFKNIDNELIEKCIIAYEPLWAIGTGKIPSLQEIQKIANLIRQSFVNTKTKNDIANSIHILYGGSVNDKNAAAIMELKDVDGLLIGGASLNPQTFISILKQSPAYLNFEKNKSNYENE